MSCRAYCLGNTRPQLTLLGTIIPIGISCLFYEMPNNAREGILGDCGYTTCENVVKIYRDLLWGPRARKLDRRPGDQQIATQRNVGRGLNLTHHLERFQLRQLSTRNK